MTKVVPILVALICSLSMNPLPAKGQEQLIFAASSLSSFLPEIINKYDEKYGLKSNISFSSSGALARQIDRGAPAQIFISANKRWIAWLVEKDRIKKNSITPYISNRLVIARSHIAPHIKGKSPEELFGSLKKGERIAIGDPSHVPLGIYTKALLTQLNLWTANKSKFTPMPNASSASKLVDMGAAAMGVIYETDSIQSKKIQTVYTFSSSDAPQITYWVAIVNKRGTKQPEALLKFLYSKEVLKSWKTSGFMVLG
ncbi:MAG: molybdate ABC transporter substrate-binding protein [Rhodospirillaceae bacterium]